MCVDKEELVACVRQVFLDAAPHSSAGRGGPWLPGTPRTVGTFRQPTALRRSAEDAAVLGHANCQLKTDALIARQQWQVSVGGRGADDLDSAGRLECAERTDEIVIDAVEQVAQTVEPLSPELDQRKQMAIAGG
jgi:hypothetical protein